MIDIVRHQAPTFQIQSDHPSLREEPTLELFLKDCAVLLFFRFGIDHIIHITDLYLAVLVLRSDMSITTSLTISNIWNMSETNYNGLCMSGLGRIAVCIWIT